MRCLFYAPGPACGVYLPAPSFEVARFILYPGLSQHKSEMFCAKGTPTLQMVFFVANYCPLLMKKSTGKKNTTQTTTKTSSVCFHECRQRWSRNPPFLTQVTHRVLQRVCRERLISWLSLLLLLELGAQTSISLLSMTPIKETEVKSLHDDRQSDVEC